MLTFIQGDDLRSRAGLEWKRDALYSEMTNRAENDLTVHFEFMAMALFVAYRALCNLETPVACIFVDKRTRRVLSYGCNDTNASLNGTRHAEFVALDKILDEYKLQGASRDAISKFFANVALYVTVEPCVMCASALQQIGVADVYFGAANDRFGGNGSVLKVQEFGNLPTYRSYGGIMRVEAIHLLRCFYIQENESAPIPKVKKNKGIEGKAFPPNLQFDRFLEEVEFSRFYGRARAKLLYPGPKEDVEVTPLQWAGYRIHHLINVSKLQSIPRIGELYPKGEPRLAADIEELKTLLPFVKDGGKVGWDFETSPS